MAMAERRLHNTAIITEVKQYMAETTDLFRNRWNNSKDNARKFDRKESCMQEHFYKHFQTEGHKSVLNEPLVTFIDKTDEKDPKKEKDIGCKH